MRTLLLMLALSTTPAHAALFDRVVAVVEDQLVLDSEVRLEGELASLDRTGSPFWDTQKDPLERLIDASVVRVAASDIALYQPSDDEVRTRREAVRAEFADRRSWTTFLDRHALTEDTLGVVLRRRIVVERFLSRNLQVSIDDRGAWNEAATNLVDGLRDRMRVRTIEPERGGGRGGGL